MVGVNLLDSVEVHNAHYAIHCSGVSL